MPIHFMSSLAGKLKDKAELYSSRDMTLSKLGFRKQAVVLKKPAAKPKAASTSPPPPAEEAQEAQATQPSPESQIVAHRSEATADWFSRADDTFDFEMQL